MRTYLRVTMDHQASNKAVKEGKLDGILKGLFERIKPETAFFFSHDGKRTANFIFDLKETSQMPVIAEPLFMELQADVEFFPVMNQEELMKGLSQLGRVG
jgi:hypothetical protein